MDPIICCACVFESPPYLAIPAPNHLCIEPKVRSTLYRILLFEEERVCLTLFGQEIYQQNLEKMSFDSYYKGTKIFDMGK